MGSTVRCASWWVRLTVRCGVAIAPLAAQTPTLYVAKHGNDRLGDGSMARPYKSLDTAVTRFQAVGDPNSTQVRFVDLDGDGDLDLLRLEGFQLSWLDNIGDRTRHAFLPPRWIGVEVPPEPPNLPQPLTAQFDAADGDGDGLADLYLVRSDGRLWFVRNQSRPGALRFDPLAEISVPLATMTGLAAIDADSDGRSDLLVNGLHGSSPAVFRMRMTAYGRPPRFDTPAMLVYSTCSLGGITFSLVDVDGDARTDLVVRPVLASGALWLRNVSTGALLQWTWPLLLLNVRSWVTTADLDGDDQPEVYGTLLRDGQVIVARLLRTNGKLIDGSNGTPLYYDSRFQAPGRVVVAGPFDGPLPVAPPVRIPSGIEVIGELNAAGSSSPRPRLDSRDAGGRALPRESSDRGLVLLESGSARFEGFTLDGADPRVLYGIHSTASFGFVERVAIHGLPTGIQGDGASMLLQNVAVSGCSVLGIHVRGGALDHVTVAGNGVGMTVYQTALPLRVHGSIVANNQTGDLHGLGSLSVTQSFLGSTAIGLTLSGTAIHRQDPGLADPFAGDLRLRAGSPAIDAAGSGGAPMDLDGNPRGIGGLADAGACEAGALALHGELRFVPPLLRLSASPPAGRLTFLLVGVPDRAGPATPFGQLLMARHWLLPLASDGSLTLNSGTLPRDLQLGFQALALDPLSQQGSLSNLVQWSLF